MKIKYKFATSIQIKLISDTFDTYFNVKYLDNLQQLKSVF